jgi:alpha-tubulin suppressor-like RCC1 family protein
MSVAFLLSCSGEQLEPEAQAKTSKIQASASGSEDAQCSDVATIAAGSYHTVGLKQDRTVAAVGYNRYGQLDVSTWTSIRAIAAGGYHTVGLKEDGTVVAVGYSSYDQ